MAQQKMRVLTVRVNNDEEREAIRFVMKHSGYARAAQAMIFACKAYKAQVERDNPVIDELRQKHLQNNRTQQQLIHSLMQENNRLRRSIAKMGEAMDNCRKAIDDIRGQTFGQAPE